jgi:hypothetical protein
MKQVKLSDREFGSIFCLFRPMGTQSVQEQKQCIGKYFRLFHTLQAGRSRVRYSTRSLVSSIYTILLAALDPGAYSASNRNEYQKQEKMFLGSRGRPVRETDNLTAICEPIS